MSATVACERGEKADRVVLEGEIDRANAERIEQAVLQATVGAGAVVIDMSAVSYLDSAGVRVLDHLARAYGNRGVALRLVAPPGGPVRLVLRIVAFGDDIVADDLERALADLP